MKNQPLPATLLPVIFVYRFLMPGGGEMTNEVPSTSTVTYGTDDDNSENVTDTSFPDTGVGYPGIWSARARVWFNVSP